MPSPFPGMDPYLESHLVWRGLHARMVVTICDQLQPQLIPNYVARVEERVILNPFPDYLWPDVHVREEPTPGGRATTVLSRDRVTAPEEIEVPELNLPHRYIEIRVPKTRRVVTIIELLSPWNKTGDGLLDYRTKQREILQSGTNLVEIDLLRAGLHAIAAPKQAIRDTDYRICIHSAGSSRLGVIAFGVRDPLPSFVVPVASDCDVVLDLGAAFTDCYDRGVYETDAEYHQQPETPLSKPDWEWSRELLREKGLL